MKFYGTRDKSKKEYSLKEAAQMGLAPCGGLFMPMQIPQIDMIKALEKAKKGFKEVSKYIASFYFSSDLTQEQINRALDKALDFDIPLKKLDDGVLTIELFRGPTFAFKDVGASCMGAILAELSNSKADKDLTILTATSGDTGSAVARGFYKIPGINVIILFPKGKVSPLQQAQMTSLGKNITALEVNGTFDDCQNIVKEAFNNKELREKYNITSANSINLLRWLPQSFYYFYSYYLWLESEHPAILEKILKEEKVSLPKPVIAVPSGNYGNIAAGMLAKKMGLPIKKFVAASNSNNIIGEYLNSGEFTPKASIQTIANAMDVGNPSNIERINSIYGSLNNLKEDLECYSYPDNQIKKGIEQIYNKYKYVSCPHSATGYLAFKEYNSKSGESGYWLSTAHPAKFNEVIEEILPIKINIPTELKELMDKEKRAIEIAPNIKDLEKILESSSNNLSNIV